MKKTVLFTAAHSGFSAEVPLGGGAAIYSQLMRAWEKTQPFEIRTLGPELLGPEAPRDKDLVHFSESEYARFCLRFEKAITEEILRHDPADCLVLSNDVSEGPNFKQLKRRGYRVFTIYHVNVTDYVTAIYLRHRLKTEIIANLYDTLERSPLGVFIPEMLRLAFGQQRDSLFYSEAVIVPSHAMKNVLLRSYPEVPPTKIHVLPWGLPDSESHGEASPGDVQSLRDKYQIPDGARILLTLSRISPEKGQDRLLEALRLWEHQSDYPPEGVWVFICGEAAFMQGQRFRARLDRLARILKKTHVVFPGHVTGARKQAFFQVADLYVFPSRHESYGLTLLEAFAAGLPALVCAHYGAEEIMQPDFGETVSAGKESDVPKALAAALPRMLTGRNKLEDMGLRAKSFAGSRRFSDTARQLAEVLLTSH